jgi:predicted Holliday junction resolvase-like endonuclease
MLKTALILLTIVYVLVMVLLFWRYRVAMRKLEEKQKELAEKNKKNAVPSDAD